MDAYLVLPLVVLGLCAILLALVLRRDAREQAHRMFALFLASMGVWGVLIFAMRASPTLEQAFVWEKAVFPAIAFTAAFYYHFTLAYTGVRRARGILISAYLFALVVSVLSPAGILATGMQLKPYGYAPITTPTFLFFFLGSSAFSVLGILNLGRAYRQSNLYRERNRYLYLMVAASLTILGAILDALSARGVPAYPGAIIANIVFCLLTGVAVLRYRLLDIRIVIRRGVAYSLLSTLVAVPYLGIILLFGHLLGRDVPFWGYVVLLVVLAPTLRPLWQRIQGMVDRWFYRERYDVFRELESFSAETHSIDDLNTTTSSLMALLRRALQASFVFLLLPDRSGGLRVTSSDGGAPGFSIAEDSPLLHAVRSSRRPLSRHDLRAIPGLQDRTETHGIETGGAEQPGLQPELFVPLNTKEGDMVGLIVLTQKRSEQPYSEEDERLVLSVANRMAVEIENARLYAVEKAMRRELERQDEQKTEFLHNVAHELKTPLTAIISSARMLNEDSQSASDELKGRLLGNITRSSWLMDRKVGELLDHARTQVGRLDLDLQPHDIRELIHGVAGQIALLFENKRQKLHIDVPDSLPPIPLDKERIEQVLLNLLSNANKFSSSGSAISVRTMVSGDELIVTVADSAATIAEEDRARVFEPYYRGGSDGDRLRIPGLGLGLSISRHIIELHGGRIWIEGAVGAGNVVIFTLPLSRPDRNGQEAPREAQDTGGRCEGPDNRG
jgi:signal transduction histidine kinase